MPVVSEVTPLEVLRRRHGLSQPELARRAGVAVATVSRCERGQRPTLRIAQAFARVLDASVDDLFPVDRP